MSDQITIFDTSLARARHQKAVRRKDYPDFLDRLIARELQARLDLLTYTFDRCLILLPASPAFEDTLRKSAQLKNIVSPGKASSPAACVQFDCEWLCFAKNSFDCVIAPPGLEKTNDLPGVFAQVAHILKPDGLFLAAMLGADTLSELRHSFLVAEQDQTGGVSPRVAPFADIRQTGNLLQRAGLALPVSDRDTVTVRYDNAFSLMREIKKAGCTNNLCQRSKTFTSRSLLLKVAEIYQSNFADEDGRVRATLDINYLTAWSPHESQQKPARPGSAGQSLESFLNQNKKEPE